MRFGGIGGVLLLIVAFPACKSTSKPDMTSEIVSPVTAFAPATANAVVRVGESRYPNLFAPDSYAVWITPEVAAQRRAADTAAGVAIAPELDTTAALVSENFYLFELHIASAFPDTSIAYDNVGLRNIDTYLVTPEGFKVSPVQRILGSKADEIPVDALKLFRRTNILVFPKRDIISNKPTIDSSSAGVRLVLEGFNSTFYFEWPAAGVPPLEESPTLSERAREAWAATEVRFSELYQKLRAISHVFD